MHRLLGSRLANLLLQSLAGVADALLFVRIWRTQSAHIGGNLSHFLAIDSANGQPRLLGIDGHGDAGRQRKLDGMGIAQREYHRVLALELRAITDADYFQFLGPALGHAIDSVVYQRADESVNRGPLVVLASNLDVAVRRLQLHAMGQMGFHLAFGPLHHHGVALDFEFHSLWKRNRFVSNSGHTVKSFYDLNFFQ